MGSVTARYVTMSGTVAGSSTGWSVRFATRVAAASHRCHEGEIVDKFEGVTKYQRPVQDCWWGRVTDICREAELKNFKTMHSTSNIFRLSS